MRPEWEKPSVLAKILKFILVYVILVINAAIRGAILGGIALGVSLMFGSENYITIGQVTMIVTSALVFMISVLILNPE